MALVCWQHLAGMVPDPKRYKTVPHPRQEGLR